MSKWLWAVLTVFWFSVLVGWPAYMYNTGTSRYVSVELVQGPTPDNRVMSYRWAADVHRSCVVSIRRKVIDSDGVQHFLNPRNDLPATPRSGLGILQNVIEVTVPRNAAVGPAIYVAEEVPQCGWTQELWPVAITYPPVHFYIPEFE